MCMELIKRNLRNFDNQSIWKGVKMVSKSQLKANKKYNEKIYRDYKLRVRKDNQSKMIEWLNSKKSINSYIIGLIEKDMKKQKAL